MKQASLSRKYYIFNFVKKTYFDEKLININRKIATNKERHVDIEKKLKDHITSCTKLINDLTRDIKLKSTNQRKDSSYKRLRNQFGPQPTMVFAKMYTVFFREAVNPWFL